MMNLYKSIFFGLLLFSLGFYACKKSIGSGDDLIHPAPPNLTADNLLYFSPDFPSEKEALTIYFNASMGDGGLNQYAGEVYLFSGVITDKSIPQSGWRHGKWDWDDVPSKEVQMESLGDGKYSLEIKDVRAFYNVPLGEEIKKLAILFRNKDGSKVGRNRDGSDLFLPLYSPDDLHIRLVSQGWEPTFIPSFSSLPNAIGEEIDITAIASKEADLSLSFNGENLLFSSKVHSISGKVKIGQVGNQLIEAKASFSGREASDQIEFVITGEAEQTEIPAIAQRDGFTRLNNGTSGIFTLYAPHKEGVFLIGDFNDWEARAENFMKRTPDGKRWWLQIDGLDPQREYAYQFLVDGTLKIADPYAEKILDPQNDPYIPSSNYGGNKNYPLGKTTGIVSVFQGKPEAYTWEVNGFIRPAKNDLVIYELHLRDFLKENHFSSLADTLTYLKKLGINALQLMPINEFEGNSSWGYNPSFYFTSDKFYGSPVMLKRLIDQCHKVGIAVVLDMVLNHSFGQSPMVQLYFDAFNNQPSADNPWFNTVPRHPFNVGYDFNHESDVTQLFTKNVLKYWMQEYKIDGFRFDLSKGFTQNNTDGDVEGWSRYDASRVAIWKEYYAMMSSIDPQNFYVILEHFAEDKEEIELSNEGMMLWNNLNGSFNEASMGYLAGSDFSRGFFDNRGFPSGENLIGYMESHDEERLMFKNLQYGNSAGIYSIKNLTTALKRQEMVAAFFFAIPGPKMIWQFGELGYDRSIDENGRTGEKPVLWNYKESEARMNLFQTYAKLIALKKDKDVFNAATFEYKLDGAIKYIILKGAKETLFVVGNFDVLPQEASIALPKKGMWYNQLEAGEMETKSTNYVANLSPGEYFVYSDQIPQ